jgi:hypothetical protein
VKKNCELTETCWFRTAPRRCSLQVARVAAEAAELDCNYPLSYHIPGTSSTSSSSWICLAPARNRDRVHRLGRRTVCRPVYGMELKLLLALDFSLKLLSLSRGEELSLLLGFTTNCTALGGKLIILRANILFYFFQSTRLNFRNVIGTEINTHTREKHLINLLTDNLWINLP